MAEHLSKLLNNCVVGNVLKFESLVAVVEAAGIVT